MLCACLYVSHLEQQQQQQKIVIFNCILNNNYRIKFIASTRMMAYVYRVVSNVLDMQHSSFLHVHY